LRGKITKKKGTPTSCVIPKKNPAKKHLQKLLTKIPRRALKITKKGKRERQQIALRNHVESSIHVKKDSYKV
jgi:hypothetical protein